MHSSTATVANQNNQQTDVSLAQSTMSRVRPFHLDRAANILLENDTRPSRHRRGGRKLCMLPE